MIVQQYQEDSVVSRMSGRTTPVQCSLFLFQLMKTTSFAMSLTSLSALHRLIINLSCKQRNICLLFICLNHNSPFTSLGLDLICVKFDFQLYRQITFCECRYVSTFNILRQTIRIGICPLPNRLFKIICFIPL